MKTRTEVVLIVLKYLSLLAAIGFSIEGGAQIVSFYGTFYNTSWAGKVMNADPQWMVLRQENVWYYSVWMIILIAASALKAWVWYSLFNLLEKLQLNSPFSPFVAKKLENISYLLLFLWVFSGLFAKTWYHYITKDTSAVVGTDFSSDQYFFIAGIVFILSQVFRRGIEMQEENQLTV